MFLSRQLASMAARLSDFSSRHDAAIRQLAALRQKQAVTPYMPSAVYSAHKLPLCDPPGRDLPIDRKPVTKMKNLS